MDDEGTNNKKTPADKAAAPTPPAAPQSTAGTTSIADVATTDHEFGYAAKKENRPHHRYCYRLGRIAAGYCCGTVVLFLVARSAEDGD